MDQSIGLRKEANMSTISNILVVLGFLLVLSIVGFGVWYFTHAMVKSGKKLIKEGLETATPGEAKIIEVGKSAGGEGDMDIVLRLEVTPQFGEYFNAITVWSVEPAHLADIQVGKSVPVKIAEIQAEKSKTKKFKSIFPDVAWAELYYWQEELTEETVKTFL